MQGLQRLTFALTAFHLLRSVRCLVTVTLRSIAPVPCYSMNLVTADMVPTGVVVLGCYSLLGSVSWLLYIAI